MSVGYCYICVNVDIIINVYIDQWLVDVWMYICTKIKLLSHVYFGCAVMFIFAQIGRLDVEALLLARRLYIDQPMGKAGQASVHPNSVAGMNPSSTGSVGGVRSVRSTRTRPSEDISRPLLPAGQMYGRQIHGANPDVLLSLLLFFSNEIAFQCALRTVSQEKETPSAILRSWKPKVGPSLYLHVHVRFEKNIFKVKHMNTFTHQSAVRAPLWLLVTLWQSSHKSPPPIPV